MTAITAGELAAPGFAASVTSFERTLLRTASRLDAYVVARVRRRDAHQWRAALVAQAAVGDARRAAAARAAIGMLPR
jgi:hypothetical protein